MEKFPPVLIIAGGLGTRIRSICADLPKSMVPVAGEPFVARQLKLLKRECVEQVIFCVAHLSQPLTDYVGDGSKFGLSVQYSYDGDELLGTGGAVLKASKLVSDIFAVMYGDSYLDVQFAQIYDAFKNAHKLGLITVYKNENRLIPSNLLAANGMVQRYDKKNPTIDMKHCDFGLSIFNKAAFANAGPAPFDLAEVHSKLIAQEQLACLEMPDRFYEVGSPEGIRDLERYLAQRQAAI